MVLNQIAIARMTSAAPNSNTAVDLKVFQGVNVYPNVSSPSSSGALSGAHNAIRIGSLDGSSSFLEGDVFEVIHYGAGLSPGDLTTVECYLRKKYGVNPSGCP